MRNTETKYLTVGDLAEELRVSVQSVHRMLRARKIDSIKFGGAVRIARADLNAYLEANRRSRQPLPTG